jgi:hypothetical protein
VGGRSWDNRLSMKKAVVIAFIVVFVGCMAHYYFAEDHCPVHCPTRGGRLGHLHHRHGDASVCLCFWSALFGPETGEFSWAMDSELVKAPDNAVMTRGPMGEDIAHPPKVLLV